MPIVRPAPIVTPREPGQPTVPIAPSGTWPGVFVDWQDEGIQEVHYQDVPCVKLLWQIAPRRPDGYRHLVSQRYHRTLERGSRLRRHLEHWQGRGFTEADIQTGLDLSVWFKRPCLLTVEHRPWRDRPYPWVMVSDVQPWPYDDPRRPLQPENWPRMRHGVPRFECRGPRPTP